MFAGLQNQKLLWPCPCQRRRKNALDRNTCFCQGRIKTLSAVPPCIHRIPCALSRIPTYPRQLTYAHTLQNTLENIHLTAPSAVHLPTCFSSGSQLPGLSVKASLTLSPLQRFNILLNFSQYTTRLYKCQESILSLFFFSDDSFFLFIRIMRM